MQEVQAICRRNGAFQCRLDESLNLRGLFRLEYWYQPGLNIFA
jgi:hypothetical protein